MNGELDTNALHAGMPAVDIKWVSQVWIRQVHREDGQPSSPVPDSERTVLGPLHAGFYRGHCLAGDDLHEEVLTIDEAKAWAARHPRRAATRSNRTRTRIALGDAAATVCRPDRFRDIAPG